MALCQWLSIPLTATHTHTYHHNEWKNDRCRENMSGHKPLPPYRRTNAFIYIKNMLIKYIFVVMFVWLVAVALERWTHEKHDDAQRRCFAVCCAKTQIPTTAQRIGTHWFAKKITPADAIVAIWCCRCCCCRRISSINIMIESRGILTAQIKEREKNK